MIDLMGLRHDHHGCRVCIGQRAEAADEIEKLREALKQIAATQPDAVLHPTPALSATKAMECAADALGEQL